MTTLSTTVHDLLDTISLVTGRVYRRRLPSPTGPFPALTYFRVDTGFNYAHDGDSGLINPRYQVSCWAEDPETAEILARDVQVAMDTWAGLYGGVALPVAQHTLTDEDTGLHHEVIDFVIWWNQ